MTCRLNTNLLSDCVHAKLNYNFLSKYILTTHIFIKHTHKHSHMCNNMTIVLNAIFMLISLTETDPQNSIKKF